MLGLETPPQKDLHQQTRSLCLLLGPIASPGNPGAFLFPLGSRLSLQAKVCPGDKRIWPAGQTGGRENPPGLWPEEWVGLGVSDI